MNATPRHHELRALWKLLAFAGFLIGGVFLVFLALGVVILLVPGYKPETGPTIVMAGLLIALAAVAGSASWACLLLLDRKPLGAIGLGFDRPWWQHFCGGTVLGVLMVTVVCVVMWAGSWATSEINPDLGEHWGALASSALLFLGVGFWEELVSRGYAFQVLARWNPLVAIVALGALFVGLHLPNAGGLDPVVIINLWLAHLLFVACYWRTRSLWLPIGLHVGWNFALGNLFGMTVSGEAVEACILTTTSQQNIFTGGAFGPEGGLIVTVLLIVSTVGVWTLIKQRRPAVDLLADR